jgi:D-psicose/D-tagatose/L-ribulose 3-epimerase
MGPPEFDVSDCARAIARTAEVGFDLIEIPALDPRSIDVSFTRTHLEKNGIGATSSLGLDAETHISSGDPEKGRRGQARLEEAIAMARDIGATHVCGILHSAFQKYSKPTRRVESHKPSRFSSVSPRLQRRAASRLVSKS